MTRKTTFFEGWSWFKFNKVGLALGMVLKFYTSETKRLKLQVSKYLGLIPTFAEVTGEIPVGRHFAPPPKLNTWIRLRPRTIKYGCNCQTRKKLPLQNQYLTPNLINKADVENNTNKGIKIYFGLAEISFKAWFANYEKDFSDEQYNIGSKLSKYIWSTKED